MLADSKALALTENFAGQWLIVRGLDDAAPSGSVFPNFDQPLRDAMRAETQLLFADVLAGDAKTDDLLLAQYTYLNDRLAQHYGLPAVGSDDA
jgi:hypothetical protein